MVGNSRLILTACVALHAPLASLLGAEPVSILLVGPGESGKTSALRFAGTFWGCHTNPVMADKLGFAVPWFATDFDLEKEALAANCTVLLLDETREQSTDTEELIKQMVQQAFRLESGFERGRGTATQRRRAALVSWMATSNISIEEGRRLRADDAVRGRMIEIPAPVHGHGMFETLHGPADLQKFRDRIIKPSTSHFGHAAPGFIEQLAQWVSKDRASLVKWVDERQQFFRRAVKKHVKLPNRAINRIILKFSMLCAVGRLAIRFKLLPLEWQDVLDALLCCLRDHIAHVDAMQARGLITHDWQRQPSCVPSPLEQLRAHVAQHPPRDLRQGLLADIAGYDLRSGPGLVIPNPKRGLEFCVSNEKLEAIVGGRTQAQQLKHHLDQTGDIATAQGTGDARYSVKRTIAKRAVNNRHRPNVIAIKAAAVGLP